MVPVAVPIPLRPMTATDIIDGGIEAVKTAPRTVLFVSADLRPSPAQRKLLVLAVVQGRPAGMGAPASSAPLSDGFGSRSTRFLDVAAPLVIHSIALVLLAATIAELVVSWYYRRPTTAGAAIAATLRRTPALLAVWAMVHVLEAVATVALVVPGVLVAALCSVAVPVLVVGVTAVCGGRPVVAPPRTRFRERALGGVLLIAGRRPHCSPCARGRETSCRRSTSRPR